MSDERSGASTGSLDSSTARAPRVWLLLGHKAGDNAQVVNLARALAWPCEDKKIVVRPEWEVAKPRIRPSLEHLDLSRTDALAAPWPDLVIAAGRRLASVALWIKQASGGRTRIVMVGMPRKFRDEFDLIVAASHYRLAPAPNVALHDLPLMPVDRTRIERAEAVWSPRFAALPRPLTALLIGGPTGGLRFDEPSARRLFEAARADVARRGGSLFVTTSRRTPAAVAGLLRREIPDGAALHVFDAHDLQAENPYHALLGLADRFIVTTDSLSMLVEVVRLGKPLAMAPLEFETGAVERALERIGVLRARDPRRDPLPAGGWLARVMERLGRPIHSRDLSAIPRRLVERRLASWLGEPWIVPAAGAGDEVRLVAERVRRVLTGATGGV
jgi:uncharacterized protein